MGTRSFGPQSGRNAPPSRTLQRQCPLALEMYHEKVQILESAPVASVVALTVQAEKTHEVRAVF